MTEHTDGGKVIAASDKDVYDRSGRLGWFDIGTVRSASVAVIGCGALGNEVVKNLLLSGYRDLTIVDMDSIAMSNLNRCLFFTVADAENERPKVEAVADGARRMAPEAVITTVQKRIQELDGSFYKDPDMVIGCLDNIEARLHLNAHCMKEGTVLIDGGTDGMRGKVQIVDGTGPCLQCVMNKSHMKVLEERYSCTGRDVTFFTPRLAAEITTTSVIAAIQVREALKVTNGLVRETMRGIMFYDGTSGTCEAYDLDISPTCPNHGHVNEGGTVSQKSEGVGE